MTDVLMKKERGMHTGRMSCGGEDRDQDNARTSHGTSKTALKPPKARREAWCRCSLPGLCQHLDLSLLVPRTEMVPFCCSKPPSLGYFLTAPGN